MTNKEAERWACVVRAIGPQADGWHISLEDLEALRRIEMTLHRWAERECNGEVEAGEGGKVYCYSADRRLRWRVANLEAGALRRLSVIMERYPRLRAYHQTDPRGCSLYVYQLDKMGDLDPDAYYSSCAMSSGVAICQ